MLNFKITLCSAYTIRFPKGKLIESLIMVTAVVLLLFCAPLVNSFGKEKKMKLFQETVGKAIQLPKPLLQGNMSLEEAMAKRLSVRDFSTEPLTVAEISQILWATQGITGTWGRRTAPSAGALYPLEVYIALREGLFHYVPHDHNLIRVSDKNLLDSLASAALGQRCVKDAPATIIIAAVYERIERKYGSRGERYVKIEVGHAAQNTLLQATALGLGAVPVGAFHDGQVHKILNLPPDHIPLYLIPVGRMKK